MNNRYLGAVLRQYEKKRQRHEQVILDRKSEIYKIIPELLSIDMSFRSNSAKIAKVAFLRDDNLELSIERLRKNHERLHTLRREVLKNHSYPQNYLDSIYDCPHCKDYGYIDLELCSCVSKACEELERTDKTSILDISTQSFENFNLELYSKIPDQRYKVSSYDNMKRILTRCKNYADTFSSKSENMLFIGNPGLSKTFLSTSIAKEISLKDFSVVYDTCINILTNFENQKFSNQNLASAESIEKYFNCDLLIIDDLGTEMVTSFTTPTLYNLLNQRIITKKPMIVNTNFVLPELSKKYTSAIASRFDGEFAHIHFFGNDIRRVIKNL